VKQPGRARHSMVKAPDGPEKVTKRPGTARRSMVDTPDEQEKESKRQEGSATAWWKLRMAQRKR
jgi:hypothetical protein